VLRVAIAGQPAIDVFETEDAFMVRAEISGLRGEDLRVKLDGDRVRITGVRHLPVRTTIRTLHRMEIAFGPFERVIDIPIPFDRERVSAHLEDGFLEVRLPRRTPTRRVVEVETE